MSGKAQFPPSVNPGIPPQIAPPPGWTLVPFGEVLDVVERPVGLRDDAEYQLVTAKRSRGGIIPREKLRGRNVLTKSQFRVEKGDFLISRRQIVHGACGIVPEGLDGAIVSNEYAVLRPKQNLTLEYLTYYSHTPHFQQTCFHSSVGVAIEKMVFKLEEWLRFPMLLPPPSEQKKVAAILGSMDGTIAATQAVIVQTRKVKQGLLQQLLTCGIGHTRFKKTEIGEIPENWRVVQVSELAERSRNSFVIGPFGSNLVKDDYRTAGVPVVFVRDIKPGKCVWKSNVFLSETKATELSAHCVKAGDLIITKMGLPPGIAAIYPPEMPDGIVTADIIRLRPDKTLVDPNFLAEMLNSPAIADQVSRRTAGQTRPKLTLRDYKTIRVPLPSKREQESIAEALSQVVHTCEANDRDTTMLECLRAGLMQDLLNGRVRVKETA